MNSQQQSGVDNIQYDLVSVWYHALKGATTYASYIKDAQQSNNQDVVQFFQDAQNQSKQLAQRAQQLMQKMGGNVSKTSGQSTSQSTTSSNQYSG